MLVKVKKKKCVEKIKNAKIYLSEGDAKKRTVVHRIARLFLALAAMIIFVWLLFLVTKGPAYISFTSDKSKENKLSLLHSQHINISADSLLADISQYHSLQTKVTGDVFYLSSSNLSSWISDYLTACGITDSDKECLVIENNNQPLEINLEYTVSKDIENDAPVRYELLSASETYICPQETNVLSSSAKSLTIYPGFVAGEAYQSSVQIPRCITVRILSGDNVSVFIAYKDGSRKTKRVEIDADVLPEYAGNMINSKWSFSVSDYSLCISAEEDEEIQLDVLGRFVLDLWSSGASKIKAYLSGDLMFQYTTEPSNYALTEQLVDVYSNKPTLNIALRKDLRMDSCEEWNGKEYLQFSGEATQASISKASLFPSIGMWLRENAYIAPLSLLGSIITIFKLPHEVKKYKKKG